MALSQRLNEKRSHLKETRMERGLDRASQENLELKTENRALRDEVERNQDERDRLVGLLEKMEHAVESRAGKKRRRGRKLAFLGLGGLAAWAFGSASGREKVAHVKERVMNDPRVQDLQRSASGALDQGADALHNGADKLD